MLLSVLLACTGEPTTAPEPPAPPPDILLVVMDTVRADALSTYGYHRPTAPNLDALAARGMLFERAISPGSWTWPSHGSLLTGRWPWEHGAHFTTAADGALRPSEDLQIAPLDPSVPTLAEQLSAAGYRTAFVSGNPIIGPSSGMARGFEIARVARGDAAVVAAALEQVQADDGRPLLLFVNLFGAHAPYSPQPVPWLADAAPLPSWLAPYTLPDGSVRLFNGEPSGVFSFIRGELDVPAGGLQPVRDLYDGEIVAVDYFLGQLAAAWPADGVIAVTSDHGEHLGERGLLDHGRTLYPEVTDVPLVLYGPGRIAPGRVSEPVSTRDIAPTLLSLAGQGGGPGLLAPAGGPVFSAAWMDPHWARELGGRLAADHRLIVEGDDRLIVSSSGETTMLGAPEREAALRAALEAAVPPLVHSGEAIAPSAETEAALRALGYVEPETPQP